MNSKCKYCKREMQIKIKYYEEGDKVLKIIKAKCKDCFYFRNIEEKITRHDYIEEIKKIKR